MTLYKMRPQHLHGEYMLYKIKSDLSTMIIIKTLIPSYFQRHTVQYSDTKETAHLTEGFTSLQN